MPYFPLPITCTDKQYIFLKELSIGVKKQPIQAVAKIHISGLHYQVGIDAFPESYDNSMNASHSIKIFPGFLKSSIYFFLLSRIKIAFEAVAPICLSSMSKSFVAETSSPSFPYP